jgi:multidrug transporter EmrE-like cation transporter
MHYDSIKTISFLDQGQKNVLSLYKTIRSISIIFITITQLVSLLFFRESKDWKRIGFITMVLGATIGLKLIG